MQVKKRRLSSRHVSVVTPGGSEVGSWEVPKHCNVLRMKQIIADRTGTHPLDQRLLHGSTMLVDGDLRELGVASGALLTLIQTPKTFARPQFGMSNQEKLHTISKVIGILSLLQLYRGTACGF